MDETKEIPTPVVNPYLTYLFGRGYRMKPKPSWFRQLRKSISYARAYDASWRTVCKILWRKLW